MALNAQVQFVHQDKPEPGVDITPTAVFDADGNPVDLGGAPAAGSVTNAMLAGGITADKLAAGVIPVVPAVPTADTLAGATDTGRAVLKAKDAAAARTAIGAGTSSFSGSYNDLSGKPTIPAAATWANLSGKPATFTPPAATATVVGGVKQAAFVADPAGDTVTKAEFVALRDALVTAGSMAPKA